MLKLIIQNIGPVTFDSDRQYVLGISYNKVSSVPSDVLAKAISRLQNAILMDARSIIVDFVCYVLCHIYILNLCLISEEMSENVKCQNYHSRSGPNLSGEESE